LKLEAIFSSETSVYFQRTKRRYILKDRTFHNCRCVNFKLLIKSTSLLYRFPVLQTYFSLIIASLFYFCGELIASIDILYKLNLSDRTPKFRIFIIFANIDLWWDLW
jgi:hypothetical protein